MGAGRWGNPLLLLAALALVLGRHQQWPGFQDSESPRNVNATLTFLLENYNNKSNDSYLFGIDKLLRSQVQVRQRHRCGSQTGPGWGRLPGSWPRRVPQTPSPPEYPLSFSAALPGEELLSFRNLPEEQQPRIVSLPLLFLSFGKI